MDIGKKCQTQGKRSVLAKMMCTLLLLCHIGVKVLPVKLDSNFLPGGFWRPAVYWRCKQQCATKLMQQLLQIIINSLCSFCSSYHFIFVCVHWKHCRARWQTWAQPFCLLLWKRPRMRFNDVISGYRKTTRKYTPTKLSTAFIFSINVNIWSVSVVFS